MVPVRLALHLTDRCQLNCTHCFRDPGAKAVDLPLDLARRTIDALVDAFAIQRLALTGGEPTLYPALLPLLDHAADRGLLWTMVSNGERFAERLAQISAAPARRRALDYVQFSLDGATPESHDAIRGVGSFRTVLRAVSTCVARGVPFALQMTLHRQNHHEAEAFVALGEGLGASEVAFNPVFATGSLHDLVLGMNDKLAYEVAVRTRALADDAPIPVRRNEGFADAAPSTICAWWQTETIYVDMRGHLRTCCMHAGAAGELDGTQDATDIADLAHTPVLEALSALEAHQTRVRELREQALSATPAHQRAEPCNWCMALHARAHWEDGASVGARAARARWRGAWADGAPVRLAPTPIREPLV